MGMKGEGSVGANGAMVGDERKRYFKFCFMALIFPIKSVAINAKRTFILENKSHFGLDGEEKAMEGDVLGRFKDTIEIVEVRATKQQ